MLTPLDIRGRNYGIGEIKEDYIYCMSTLSGNICCSKFDLSEQLSFLSFFLIRRIAMQHLQLYISQKLYTII